MNESTLNHYVAFVDYDNDFGMPEQRLVGPFDLAKAKEVEEKMQKAGGVTNTERIRGNNISSDFPLNLVHPVDQ